jgi:hypothetical protein
MSVSRRIASLAPPDEPAPAMGARAAAAVGLVVGVAAKGERIIKITLMRLLLDILGAQITVTYGSKTKSVRRV